MASSLTKSRPSRVPSLWRNDPFSAFQEEMNQLRSRFFGDGEEGWFTGAMAPALDLSEDENAIEVRMDLPGVDAKDIDVQVSGNILTVSGQRKEEKEEKGKTYHRVERRSGGFSRSITLPCEVTESEVAAEYRDGVLNIKLPKCEEAKVRKIEVKT